MANINEVFNSKRTHEELVENARKAGKASGEARKQRKTLREELLALLEKDDVQKNMTIQLLAKALDGDIKAYEVVRDTIGEKSPEKIDANVDSKVEIHIGIEDE